MKTGKLGAGLAGGGFAACMVMLVVTAVNVIGGRGHEVMPLWFTIMLWACIASLFAGLVLWVRDR